MVFAAASLKNALDEIAATWAKDTGKPTPRSPMPPARRWPSRSSRARRPTCSSPPTSTGWTTSPSKSLIKAETRVNLLGNRHRAGRAQGFEGRDARRSSRASISPGCWPTASSPMGDVDAVPAGKYGKAALEKLGGWDSGRRTSVAQAENVRAALPPGLARRSAARHRLHHRRRGRSERQDRRHLPGGRHPPIIYPAAVTRMRRTPTPSRFLDYLRSGQGAAASRSRASRSWRKSRLTPRDHDRLALNPDGGHGSACSVALDGDDRQPAVRHRHRLAAGARALPGQVRCSTRWSICRWSCRRSSPATCCCSASAGAARSAPSSTRPSASSSRSAGPARRLPRGHGLSADGAGDPAVDRGGRPRGWRTRPARWAPARSGCS